MIFSPEIPHIFRHISHAAPHLPGTPAWRSNYAGDQRLGIMSPGSLLRSWAKPNYETSNFLGLDMTGPCSATTF